MHDTIDRRQGEPVAPAASGEGFWRATILVLAVVVIGAGWPLLLRTTAAVQIDYDEGWNAYRAQSAAHLLALYSALPKFEITNYPPLSFHIIGLLSRFAGDVTTTGRVLSLVSLAVICWAIRLMTGQFTASGYAGTCAALLFALWLEVWMPNRIGVNDPQLLGMAFEVMGLYVFIRHRGSRRGEGLSAILFALAVFTKQNLVALPIGAGMSLVVGGAWRSLLSWVAAGLLSAAVLLLATRVVDGPYLFSHIMTARAYSVADAVSQSGLYLLAFLPYVAIAAVWTYRNRACSERRPLVLSWLAAHVAGFVFSGGDGTGRNMFFEAMVLDAVIVVVAYGDYFTRTAVLSTRRSALFLFLLVIFPICQLPATLSASLREWHNLPRMQDDFERGVSLLRSSSSPVLCENLLMCERAGKASAFDPYFVRDQIKVGRIDACDIVDLVGAERIAMVELGDVDGREPPARSRARFTKLFMQTLLTRYKISLQTPEFTLWVPASAQPPATATTPPASAGNRCRIP
jgi:hypothetical protein